jgi:nondiscriminating glutamyl-tRNA synthetase
MHSPELPDFKPRPNPYSAADVLALLREHGWLKGEATPQHAEWCAKAASLLGHFAADRAELAETLRLIFAYDADAIARLPEAHAVLARHGAREVIRHLALFLLEPALLDSDRFKQLVDSLKRNLELRSRDLFHPIRLALTGRSGEGQLDRVILLLDPAAALPFAVPVKSARARILEFCSAVD